MCSAQYDVGFDRDCQSVRCSISFTMTSPASLQASSFTEIVSSRDAVQGHSHCHARLMRWAIAPREHLGNSIIPGRIKWHIQRVNTGA